MSARLLIVEDEPTLARGLADNFRDEGYLVSVVDRGDMAMAAVRDFRPELVILDVMLPGRSGLDVLRDLRATGSSAHPHADRQERRGGPGGGPRAGGRRLPPQAVRGARAPGAGAGPSPPGGGRRPWPRWTWRGALRLSRPDGRGPAGPVDLTPHDIRVLQFLADRRGESCPASRSWRRSAASTPRPPFARSTTMSWPCAGPSATTRDGPGGSTPCVGKVRTRP